MFLKLFKKLGVFLLLAFFISFFLGCEDKSYFKQIYNQKLYNEPITCLKLELNPFNQDIYAYAQTLYRFDSTCNTILNIRYKTNIACNSPYSTNQSFKSFIELNLIKNDILYYTLYKDLKDDDFNEEIKKAFDQLHNFIVIH